MTMMSKKEKKKIPVFWICGNYFQSKKTFQQICAKMNNPRIEILDCDWSNDSKNGLSGSSLIIQYLRTQDIFDKRQRIIKVKGLPSDYSILTDYLRFVNNDTVLVIDGPIGYKAKPPSAQFISAKNSNFYKKVNEIGYVIDHGTEAKDLSAAAKWAGAVAEDLGKAIDQNAACILVELKGRNLDEIYSSLVILVDYAEGKSITKEDVENICVPVFLKTVWQLIDCIASRNGDDGMVHLQQFYDSMEHDTDSKFYGEIQKIIGALHQLFLFAIIVYDYADHERKLDIQRSSLDITNFLSYSNLCKAVDGLKSKGSDGKWSNALFSTQYINMKTRDGNFKNLIKLGRPNIYKYFSEINKVRACMRTDSSVVYYKMCLDSLICVLCNKYGAKEADMLRRVCFLGIIE